MNGRSRMWVGPRIFFIRQKNAHLRRDISIDREIQAFFLRQSFLEIGIYEPISNVRMRLRFFINLRGLRDRTYFETRYFDRGILYTILEREQDLKDMIEFVFLHILLYGCKTNPCIQQC